MYAKLTSGMQLKQMIIAQRKSKGLSQGDMADILDISQQSYSKFEAAPHKASFERLLKVLSHLNASLYMSDAQLVPIGNVNIKVGSDVVIAPAKPIKDRGPLSRILRNKDIKNSKFNSDANVQMEVKKTTPMKKKGPANAHTPSSVQTKKSDNW